MKKIFLLLIILVLLTGCGNKEKDNTPSDDNFVLEKIDKDKDYVYFEDFKILKLNKDVYKLQYCIINIKGNVVDNINLELRNFVLNSYNSMDINTDYINYGNIISYRNYQTDKYISVLQDYYFYIGKMDEAVDSNVYVIDLETGKLLSNNDILKIYNYTEDKLFDYIRDNVNSDDIEFSMMQIRNEGYKLYINDDENMVMMFTEELNDGKTKKELIIN